MRESARFVAGCLLFVSTWAAPGQAQECLLTPVSVPGLSGLPFWYAEAGKVQRTELDDPRWAGGPVRAFANNTAANSTAFRVVREGNIIAVSLQALADGNGPTTFDAAYIGISTSTSGSTAYVLRLAMPNGATDPVSADFSSLGTLWTRSSGAWDAGSSTAPDWLIDTGTAAGTQFSAWRNSPAGAVWAVNLKIDLGALGVASSADFTMTYGLDVHSAGSNCVVNPGGCTITPFATPAPPSAANQLAGTPFHQDPTQWELTEDRDTVCTGGAVLSSYRIGVNNADGSGISTIDTNGTAADPATVADPATNTFYADVYDIANATIPAGIIRAKFSLANWGSTIADSAAPWDVVEVNPDTPTLAENITSDAAPAPSGPANSARVDFVCGTGASGNVYCPQRVSAAHQHQCMLVELKEASPAVPVKFSKAAAYRNMNFETLSELSRPATITLKGLKELTGVDQARDVYLYVQTLNMPKHGAEPLWLPTKAMAEAKRYAENPPPRPPLEVRKDGQSPDLRGDGKAPPKAGLVARAIGRAAAAANGEGVADDRRPPPVLSDYQAISEVWPTYSVHVYYDSGELVPRFSGKDKAMMKVLVEMVPFGFHLSHDGALYGFSHSLEGLGGVKLEKVPDMENWYKVKIESEGSIQVGTKIVAEEKPLGGGKPAECSCDHCAGLEEGKVPPKHGCGCSMPGLGAYGSGAWALGALVTGGLLLRRRRTRAS